MLTNDQLAQWDRDNFFHPSTHLAEFARGNAPQRIITTAKDCHITDRDGTRLLDAFAGLYCVNVGYGRQEIAEAIADQARELAYYRGEHHPVQNDSGPCPPGHVQGVFRPVRL